MKGFTWAAALSILLANAGLSYAQSFEPDQSFVAQGPPPTKKDVDTKQPEPIAPPFDVAQLAPPRDQIRTTINPPMVGDFIGPFARTTFTVNTQVLLVPIRQGMVGQAFVANVTDTSVVAVPVLYRGAFKLAENESPRPLDRVYVSYNYFHNIPLPQLAGSSQFQLTRVPPVGTNAAFTMAFPATLTRPTLAPADAHRLTFGFEKTFLDGDASIGVRLPMFYFNQTVSTDLSAGNTDAFLKAFAGVSDPGAVPVLKGIGNGTGSGDLGDVTLVTKYALVNDRATGNLLSVGLGITLPTADTFAFAAPDGGPHSTLLQPYVGAIRNFDRFFLHGFSSLVVPTDNREPILWFNDVGLGWWLYRGENLTVTPTLEAHLTTPLSNRDESELVRGQDFLNLTGGVHFLLGRRTNLMLGVVVPLTGPNPFDAEATAQLNFLF